MASASVPAETMFNDIVPAVREMNDYLLGHVRRCRREPADDVLTQLATARVDGRELADGEVVGLIGLTLLAGHATTTALIGNAVVCFDRHPEVVAELRADRTLVPAAVEEVLRFRPPFSRLSRVTTTDAHIGDHVVPAGELVTTWIGAANRDPACFVDPARFDIHRGGPGHTVFGHGVHYCIGAPLARLEGAVALNTLLDRYRHIEIDPSSAIEFANPLQIIAPARLPVLVSS